MTPAQERWEVTTLSGETQPAPWTRRASQQSFNGLLLRFRGIKPREGMDQQQITLMPVWILSRQTLTSGDGSNNLWPKSTSRVTRRVS